MRIALYQPDIPQNTGTILRLAACLAVPVDIIGPAGFDISDRNLRRAGLDYLDAVNLSRHLDWAAFLALVRRVDPAPRLVLATTKAAVRYVDFAFRGDDILLFGRESAGVPDTVHEAADAHVRVPVRPGLRSLNLAVATAMISGEALRQTQQWPGSA